MIINTSPATPDDGKSMQRRRGEEDDYTYDKNKFKLIVELVLECECLMTE